MMKNILIIGAKGQLGECLREVFDKQKDTFNVIYTDYSELDATSEQSWKTFLEQNKYDFVINCAAYTAVDKAENDIENAYKLNAKIPHLLGEMAVKYRFTPIHISTDYVFSGNSKAPYKPSDQTNPQSVYGETKLEGEKLLLEKCPKSIIIRTSWLYSVYGNNFVKTMLRLSEDRNEIGVVCDQIGRPTSAHSLAEALLNIVKQDISEDKYGIYHFQNSAEPCSWADFAKEIFLLAEKNIKVNYISSQNYPTPAKRPSYSVLDCSDLENNFFTKINDWKIELKKVIQRL